MANTWNQSGTTWNTGRWGTTDAIVQGWSAKSWNEQSWGDLNDVDITLSSLSITSNVSANAWNESAWGTVQGWGIFSLEVADVVGLTGVQITSAVPSQFDIPEQIQGLSITSSVGSISPTEMSVGLSGQSGTLSVGATTFDLTSVVIPTGQQITSNAGDVITGLVEFVPVTGVSATLSVGSISLDQMTVGLSGQSRTLSVGSIAPADVVGLTGQEITSSLAAFGTSTGFGIQAYQAVDTGSNISYSDVATGTNITYKDVA